jgi:PqqA peptide cyclase
MDSPRIGPPASLLAEVTHRCPLHCLYCSNPLELTRREAELPTETWLRVLDEAADLGVLQVHLSGGEPLARADLSALVERAARLQMYVNLITSGVGLSRARTQSLRDAGLGAVQLSIQAADAEVSRLIAGGEFREQKMAAARYVREAGVSLSVNVVLHRHNLSQVTALLDLATALGAERVELANAQYYGWALRNRTSLLPTREMLRRAEDDVAQYRRRSGTAMEILWIVPDYYAEFPKPCMNGWGRLFLTIAPDGRALPCPVASVLPSLAFPAVTAQSLRSIWYESVAFNRFRGFDWMPDPCRSCPRRFEDFGGCRCQAYLLTGEAAVTDPVCIYSPHHALVTDAVGAEADERAEAFAYRAHAGTEWTPTSR